MSIVQNLLAAWWNNLNNGLPQRKVPQSAWFASPSLGNNVQPTVTNESIQNQSGYDLSFLLPIDQREQPNFATTPWRTQPARQNMANRYNTATQYGMFDTANDIASLAENLANRDKFVNNVTGIYDNFWSYLADKQNDRNSIYGALQQDLLGELSGLYNQYTDSYWPDGSMTNKVNSYYDNLSDYLVRKQANQQLLQSGLANKYWLSDNARRISENDAAMRWQAEILKAFQDETSMLDNINKTYNQLLDGAFQRYAWVQDEYVRWLADSNFNVQTQLAQTLTDLLANNEAIQQQMRLQQNGVSGWWWGGGRSYVTVPEMPTQNAGNETAQSLIQQWANAIRNLSDDAVNVANAVWPWVNLIQNLLRRSSPDPSSSVWKQAQQYLQDQ